MEKFHLLLLTSIWPQCWCSWVWVEKEGNGKKGAVKKRPFFSPQQTSMMMKENLWTTTRQGTVVEAFLPKIRYSLSKIQLFFLLQMTWIFTWLLLASKRAKNWGYIWIWYVVWNILLLCLYLPMHFPAIQLHKTILVISSSYWLLIVSPNINLVVTCVSLNVPNPHYYHMWNLLLIFFSDKGGNQDYKDSFRVII